VSIARLKANLASYMRKVKDGASVVITDRGVPVGKLTPFRLDPGARNLLPLIAAGLVAPPENPLTEEFFRRAAAVKDPYGRLLKPLLAERRQA
jgi:prevent-host-death family protein